MDTPEPNSAEPLCAEILTQGRRQGDEILQQARERAATLLAEARTEAQRLRQGRIAAARQEATRRTDLVLATVPVEAGRQRSASVEALLQEIYVQADRALAEHRRLDCRATFAALAAQAIERMVGDSFVVELSATDHGVAGNGLVQEIQRCLGPRTASLTIGDRQGLREGSLLVHDAAGRQVWDNSLEARLARAWPELRRQIAERTSLATAGPTAAGKQ